MNAEPRPTDPESYTVDEKTGYLHKEEGGVFVGKDPETGTAGQAGTIHELFENIKEGARLYKEDQQQEHIAEPITGNVPHDDSNLTPPNA